jgi:hypothetical protein
MHVEQGETLTFREETERRDYRLEWRALRGGAALLDVLAADGAMPAPLERLASNGRAPLRLRFEGGVGGLGTAVLGGATPLAVERATVEAIWLPGHGADRLHPVAALFLEGPLALDSWAAADASVAEDPAPGRDLVDEVRDPELRYLLARGTARVLHLDAGSRGMSTWELAAVSREGREVPDWQERVRAAYGSGRLDLVADCRAVVREHAFGARRGRHLHEVPLLRILLASEIESSGRRWTWRSVVVVEPGSRDAAPASPAGLPASTFRIVTLRDRRYRHGPSGLVGAVLGAFGSAGAWLLERGLGFRPDRSDGWGDWFRGWEKSGQGEAHRKRASRSP